MEIKSLLIKDTTKEEHIRIVQEGLNQCGGSVDSFYEPYLCNSGKNGSAVLGF